MDLDLAQKAVSAALNGNWTQAAKLNKEILKENPKDVEALNRLARANFELGKLKTAKKISEKVLKIDPFNSIAVKSLARWKVSSGKEKVITKKVLAETFLEEPGKTKIIPLICLGDKNLIAKLDSGDEVILSLHGHRVAVTTLDGKYIGRLPDDQSARLKYLINAGFKYQVLVKSIDAKNVKIFVREIEKGEKLKDVTSFPTEKIEYTSFTPPELVRPREEEPTPEIEATDVEDLS